MFCIRFQSKLEWNIFRSDVSINNSIIESMFISQHVEDIGPETDTVGIPSDSASTAVNKSIKGNEQGKKLHKKVKRKP